MKVDLAEMEEDVREWVFRRDETLALIRVARAAKVLRDWRPGMATPGLWAATAEMDAALSDIEDSKHD
jgi:hypothetical protein